VDGIALDVGNISGGHEDNPPMFDIHSIIPEISRLGKH
jgi:hypothetical protein